MSTNGDFSKRITTIVSNGYLTAGLAIGQQLGLFTAMIDIDKPTTSTEVAAKAGCKERLVREWLHQMAVGGIVHLNTTNSLFSLPDAHRAGLQTAAMSFASILPASLYHHAKLLSAFRSDGPPGLTSADTFELQKTWESGRPAFFKEILPKVISMTEGLHEKLTSGLEVADVGAGRGHLLILLGKMYPHSRFTGVEISEGYVEEANHNKGDMKNVNFNIGDVCKLPSEWTETFDLVLVCDILHDLPQASKSVFEIRRITKTDGLVMILDIFSHSDPIDNLNDPSIMILLGCSMYSCLSQSMYEPGSEALGTCAGIETLGSLLLNGGFDMSKVTMNKIGFCDVVFICQK